MAASPSISLTEELFQITCLHQYQEYLQAIHPGKGISENMFATSAHGIDDRLTYKVNKTHKGKTMKNKKVNPNLMFTMFTAFVDHQVT